jgi:hypothetical protein
MQNARRRPASWEDLEAELDEDQLGPISSLTPLAGRKLVIQAKLRNTGPWDVAALERLLKHGEDREPAATRPAWSPRSNIQPYPPLRVRSHR